MMASCADQSSVALRQSGMTFLRIVIPLYLFDLRMIFSENRYPLFRIMRYGSRRFDRACLNHLRNMSSVSIISVKPALLIFTVETIEGGPGWVWP